MRRHRTRGIALFVLVILLPGFLLPAAGVSAAPPSASFSQLSLYPNIETLGVVVSGTGLPFTAELFVRESGAPAWQTAHPLMLIKDGRLAGSLFSLAAATTYDVKVVSGASELTGSVTTQPDVLPFTPSSLIYVNASASAGGNGSAAAPFQTIQAGIDHALPGTRVLVADGIYREALFFPSSGTPGNWIQVKAQGSGAVLDGSQHLSGDIWSQTTFNNVYFTRISGPIAYLARDGQRFYAYDDRTGLNKGMGHGGVSMSEGWWLDPLTLKLYVRSTTDPKGHTWQVPVLNRAFNIAAQDWLWIEGFEIRYYGTATSGCGVCTLNASHIVVRANRIHNLQLGVYINWTGSAAQGNDARIEFNDIYDPPVNQWKWQAVKGTSMEGTAIVVRGRTGAIVRGNELRNFFNGVYTGSSAALDNPALAFDADIYDNSIHDIGDDALEPEGACVNHRFRNNVIDRVLVGLSAAPVTYGPAWVLRNTFSNYTGRAFKWDSGSDGILRVYHNTAWTTTTAPGMDFIHAAHNATLRNNIFRGTGYNVYELATGSIGHDWDRDDWYTSRAAPRFIWENTGYGTLADLCANTGLECNGFSDAPGLVAPAAGDFALAATSPNIDRGIPIPGINDGFAGAAPDIGALESAYGTSVTIAGSTGIGGVILSYYNGGAQSVLSGPGGAYVITVPSGWSGAVTPSKTGYTFSPPSLNYDTLASSLTGQDYTPVPVTALKLQFQSRGGDDGWILESGEATSAGGSKDAASTGIQLGDDDMDRQYRVILSFDTSALPEGAVITSAVLRLKQKVAPSGTNPFLVLGGLLVDLRAPYFGSSPALQLADFNAPAGRSAVGTFSATPANGWYRAALTSDGRQRISTSGLTQFRLYFTLGDNDNRSRDSIKFFSGNADPASRPLLVVQYLLP